ncbi:hypothetical protein SEA_LITTLEFELLA_11 [Gordonia phage LittleFella]|nr:hypothetical protein SEA_LITTLEFELLA_11 [Gordonia phage LittleFella]
MGHVTHIEPEVLMKSTVLRKGIARNVFVFGCDPKKFPKINLDIPATPAFQRPEDEEGDEDFSHIEDQRDRNVARLSRENSRRRLMNKAMTKHMEKLVAENEALRKELGKVPQAEDAFNTIVSEREDDMGKLKNMAILRAIESDSVTNEKGEVAPRAWYDVSMVRSLLNTDELAVDLSDFSVGGLSEQLNKIATEKPFLVKSAGGDKREDSQQQQRPPSGSAPQSSATGNRSEQNASNEKEMLADFPALQNLI